MDSTEVAFSVVIPLYNKAPYIERALTSALAQLHPAAEIVVIDDGSTDEGPSLVQQSFPKVRLIRQPNAGPGPARNAGMQAATSPWIAFLDADDIWLPNHLNEVRALSKQFPTAELLSTGHTRWTAGEALPRVASTSQRQLIDYFYEASKNISIVWTSSAAVLRSSALQTPGFSSHPAGEDLAMWARMALRAPVAVSTAITAVYAQDTLGVMSTHEKKEPPNEDAHQSPIRLQTPSMSVVEDALESGTHIASPSSMRKYLNSRVISSMRGALLSGHTQDSRRLRAQLQRGIGLRDTWVVGMSYLPRHVLSLALAARGPLRSMHRHHD